MRIASGVILACLLSCWLLQSASGKEPAQYRETVLHIFASAGDGADPRSPVIEVKGTLYGTTYSGGDQGFGALYRFDLQTGQEDLLFSFPDRAQGALIRMKGTLYSTTAGFDD